MSRPRWVWALGVAAFVLAVAAAVQIALVLPFAYDFRAYWMAAQHLAAGEPLYPGAGTPLGRPSEFHYLPIVAVPFLLFAPLPFGVAALIWLGLQLLLAAAIGVTLIRPLPRDARPWAAAAYAFFLPGVLEITLGNLDLASLALVLLAWRWRARTLLASVLLAVGVGLKFLPTLLVVFYAAQRRVRLVVQAALVGVAGILVTLPFLLPQTREYLALAPRFTDSAFARVVAERDEPAFLAGIFWSDAFPLALRLGALSLAIACGLMARRQPERETDWHHVALAASPYLLPFGFVWTTVLVTSLPLFARSLGRALALAGALRVAATLGLAACWVAMQVVQVHDLVPLASHLVGVVGLVVISLGLMAIAEPQTLGRSTSAARATSSASG